MKTETEIGGMQPQTKELLEEARKDSPCRAFGGSAALMAPSFQTSGLQSYERINSCCFKPLNLLQHL